MIRELSCLADNSRAFRVVTPFEDPRLDLAAPAGRLMANVLASVAQYETEIRAERVLAGIAVARTKGVRFGRPGGIHTRIKVREEQAVQVAKLKAAGETIAAISRATGLSRPTVYSILKAV